MRGIDVYAIVATTFTVGVTLFFGRLLRRPGPQRGFGAGQALIVVVGAVGIALLHGSVACIIAIATGATTVTWICSGVHAAVLLAGLALAIFK